MKTIGLIGGTSWVSTVEYYKLLNQLTNERLGGINAAKVLLYSLNYGEFKVLLDQQNLKGIEDMLLPIAKQLEAAGVDCLLLCANTPHMVADQIQQQIKIPLIHIAEETAKEVTRANITKVGLLGTRFTMEQPFFKERLSRFGILTVIPGEEDCNYMQASIFNELAKGIFTEETKTQFLRIIDDLTAKGAGGVILGCTEIPMFIKQEDCRIPVFDTTLIHSIAAVNFSLR